MEPNNQFNQDVNTSAPISAENPVSTPMESKKKVGPIVAILAIVLILIIGVLYLFASGINNTPTIEEEAGVSETVVPVTSNSDDVSDLDADLEASIDGIDEQNF